MNTMGGLGGTGDGKKILSNISTCICEEPLQLQRFLLKSSANENPVSKLFENEGVMLCKENNWSAKVTPIHGSNVTID